MGHKPFCLGNKGFSIISIIMSAGIMSGLAMTLATVTKKQQIFQKKTETYFEVSNLSYLILRTLEDEGACTQTLGAGTTITKKSKWSSIKNKDGGEVVVKNKKYGDRLLKINKISARNVNISGTAGEMELEVKFQKIGASAKSKKDFVSKRYPLSIDVDAAGQLVRCRSNYSNIVSTGKERMCRMLNGVYDPIAENCELSSLLLEGQKAICESLDGTFIMAPKNCDVSPFISKSVQAICTSLQGSFDSTASRCLLSSTSPGTDRPGEEEDKDEEDKDEEDKDEDEDLLNLKDSYPVCRIGFGASIAKGSRSQLGKDTFTTCFGVDEGKLFKLIQNGDHIQARTSEWEDAWMKFDADGALETINYYRRSLSESRALDYMSKIYYMDADPLKPLLPFYELSKTEIKMKYAKTGKWYMFRFSTGINFPDLSPIEHKDKRYYEEIERLLGEEEMRYDYQWLGPWRTLVY